MSLHDYRMTDIRLEMLEHENKKLKKAIATALIEAKIYNGIPEMDKIAAILEAAVREVG